MNRMKALAAILGVAVMMAVVAACGNAAEPTSLSGEVPTRTPSTVGGTTPTDSNPPTTMEIGQSLNAPEGSEVTTIGLLIANRDGSSRLCSVLLESDPPQCGGDRIDLLGFDASSVPNSRTPQRPSEIPTVRWTTNQITITGIRVIGGLAEVRLSTEAPTTQQDPDAPAPTDANPPITPIVSHGGPVKDYVSLVDTLRAAGATVDPAGPEVFTDYFAPPGQLLTVNGELVTTFEFGSAEEADAAAEGVSASGTSIVGPTMADGTSKATAIDWIVPAHFYKAGKLIVLYVACDDDVIDLLQETMGPQFAGGAGLSQCP